MMSKNIANTPESKFNINIRTLDSTKISDYISFFDNIKIIDNSECSKCYCMFFHTDDKTEDWVNRTAQNNKNSAIEKIERGELFGFLAYDDNKPIAWCNVNDRNIYKFNKSRFDVLQDNKNAISIVCFYIMQSYRGKGIINILLKNIIEYYKDSDYKYLEAYPSTNKTKNNENYHGPLSSYLKNGFSIIKEMEEVDDFGDYEKYCIVRYNY